LITELFQNEEVVFRFENGGGPRDKICAGSADLFPRNS
jgi:hypothetical protein